MRKIFSLFIALLALTVSSWATTTTVPLTGSDLANFFVSADGPGSSSQTINGSVNITVTAYAPATGDYSHIAGSSISVDNGGTLTFTTSQGKLTRIYIECNQQPTNSENIATGTGWNCSGDPELTWTGDASSVELASNGSSSFYFGGIQYIEFTVDVSATPSSSVEWNAGNGLNEVGLVWYNNYDNQNIEGQKVAQIPGGITATISASEGTAVQFQDNSISLMGGTLTFTTASGQFERIVINTNNGNGYKNPPYKDWSWSNNTLTWQGALPSSTVVLDDASVDNITSIVFTFAGAAPASDGTITWGSRQANHVSLSCSSVDQIEASSVIKDIITSLEKTEEGEYCEFISGTMHISDCGELTFQSIVGELTGIVISCSHVENATDLSDDWTYDDGAKTLTWAGTSSNEVTLSGDIYCFISSIEFTYTPVSAPRLGQTFTGSYGQTYEITGLHTAKVIPQSIFGTLDIPDYEVYDYETYYITEIDDYAFSIVDNDIANAYIGANVAKIGAHAFENNSHMTEVFVRSTVLDAIGEEAFKNCLLLHGFECYTNMPPALGNDAFYGDTRINRITVSNPYDYQDADGWLSYAAKIKGSWVAPEAGEIFFYDNQTTVNLYAVVAGATYNTRGQEKVMPYTSDVNGIYQITRTGKLIIPEEVMYMGRPYDVTGIGANAYKDCADVNVVMIPQQMTSIEAGAFSGCMGIKNVFFLWNDPTSITWADRTVGAEFATAGSGNTKIFVPEGTLTAYQTWAPAWASCMYEGEILDVTAAAPDAEDTEHIGRFYRTFYDSSSDYMLPPSVWAHVGYVEGNAFMLRPIAFDGEIIPKGTAVVLESETPSYRLIAVPGDAPAYTGQNDLRGTDVDLAVSTLGADADKVYVLNREATLGTNRLVGMGMYKYTGSMLGAHKAYLIYDAPAGPNSAPARFVFKHENQATGVENVQSDKVQCTKVIRDGQLILIKDGKEFNAQGLIIK